MWAILYIMGYTESAIARNHTESQYHLWCIQLHNFYFRCDPSFLPIVYSACVFQTGYTRTESFTVTSKSFFDDGWNQVSTATSLTNIVLHGDDTLTYTCIFLMWPDAGLRGMFHRPQH